MTLVTKKQKVKKLEIKNIVVIGSGTMGSGIAYVAAAHGYKVVMNDIDQGALDKAIDRLRHQIMGGIQRGKMSPKEGEQLFNNISTSVNLEEAAKTADLVIEAVFENMDVKKQVFKKLSDNAPSHALLASNTSTLSITEIATATDRPEQVIGLHFFNPPAAMKLVEVVVGEKTSEQTIATAKEFVASLEKTPIVAKDSPGFIVNRILVPVLNEAIKLYDEGVADIESIDKAMVLGANFPVGPFALADMVGLDVALASMRTLESKLGPCYAPSKSLVRLVEEGKLGTKSGKGFYEYSK